MDDLAESVSVALMAIDPRRSADTALAMLLPYLRCCCVGLFRIQQRRIALFANRCLDQVHLDRAIATWKDASESLLAGHTFTEDALAMIPLGTAPDGLLYLGSTGYLRVSPRATEAVQRLEHFLVAALVSRESESPIHDYLRTTPPEAVEREQLLVLLRSNAWNVSKVARDLGVTRMTVYQRMARYRIPRERPTDDR
jgi:hypothetical protein